MPKQFRDYYESMGGFPGVYAYPSPKLAAIEGCHEERMKEIAESLDDLDLFSEEQNDFATVVLESAHQLPFDPEGRVVLPAELIAHAGLDGEAMFVGRGDTFHIWNPEAYDLNRAEIKGRVRESRVTLRLRRQSGVPR